MRGVAPKSVSAAPQSMKPTALQNPAHEGWRLLAGAPPPVLAEPPRCDRRVQWQCHASSTSGVRRGLPIRWCRRLRSGWRSQRVSRPLPRRKCGPGLVPQVLGSGAPAGPAGCHGRPYWTATHCYRHGLRPGGRRALQAGSLPQHVSSQLEPLALGQQLASPCPTSFYAAMRYLGPSGTAGIRA
jgi:hypothetical protein